MCETKIRKATDADYLDTSSSNADSAQLSAERKVKMTDASNFYWSYTDEPHASRRKAIVAAHPEVKELFGHCPYTKFKVLLSVMVQLVSVHLLHDNCFEGASSSSSSSPSSSSSFFSFSSSTMDSATWWFCCYALSGTINHMMTLAMHELSHNLGFKRPLDNRFLAMFANLPMGIPAAASFRRYHLEHHRFQGEDILDVDVPTSKEGFIFTNTPLKIIWCLLQPLFYSLRPSFVNPKTPSEWELVNISVQVVFDAIIFKVYGIWGLLYLVLGTLFGMGLHPVAGHFIAEHYVMNKGQETYSYYGPLNWLTFNVGYHNEHHDFPFVAGTNLPAVRAIAPEFYDNMPHYHSWTKVIVDYVLDDKVGPFSRIKRVTVSNKEIEELKARGGLIK